MPFAVKILICFGFPLIGIILYHKIFARVEDNTVFFVGLFATINYLLIGCFLLTALLLDGVSGMHFLMFFYLVHIAPVFSFGFVYWIWRNRKRMTQYSYALLSNLIYLTLMSVLFLLIILRPF